MKRKTTDIEVYLNSVDYTGNKFALTVYIEGEKAHILDTDDFEEVDKDMLKFFRAIKHFSKKYEVSPAKSAKPWTGAERIVSDTKWLECVARAHPFGSLLVDDFPPEEHSEHYNATGRQFKLPKDEEIEGVEGD